MGPPYLNTTTTNGTSCHCEIAACPSSAQVEWNTIFYILLPLATSTMAQPVGSVLGTSPVARIYWRSSPIFCAIDTLVFLIEILLYRTFRFDSLAVAGAYVTDKKYSRVVGEPDNLQSATDMTVLRWVFFIIGTHGCILKLAGAHNILWSKIWGFTYVASFCIQECMVFTKRRRGTQTYVGPTASTSRQDPFTDAELPATIGFLVALTASAAVLCFALYGLTIKSYLALMAKSHNAEVLSSSPEKLLKAAKVNYIAAIGVFLLCVTFYGCIIDTLARYLVRWWPSIGEKLLLLDTSEAEIMRSSTQAEVKLVAWRAASGSFPPQLFLTHFGMCLLWYKFIYDPSGTIKAAWADVLG